jgi:hypothetical protein
MGYVPVMFQSAPVTPPVGPGTKVDGAGDGGSGVTFSLINDTGNFWDLPTSSVGPSTLTIPVGVFAVTDVWTMINDIEATASADVSVTFNFGTNSNGIGGTNFSKTVQLGDADGASSVGQVRNGLVCAVGCAETAQVGLSGTSSGGINVVADNVWSQSYLCPSELPTSLSGETAPICGTAYLDDQGFYFNSVNNGAGLTNMNTYLVSVKVKEIAMAGGGAGLSAITIDTAPEPSTVLLFVAGLGVVGLGRLRKRA